MRWKKHSIYSLEAFDSKNNLVCNGETRNAIDFGRMCQMLNVNGYKVIYTPYDEKVNLLETLRKSNWRVARNYFFALAFIISMVICYFKDNTEHTVLKGGITVWVIILIGWCINFILDNHYKMDKEYTRTTDVLSKFDERLDKGKIDESVKKAATLEIKDIYKLGLEERKTFQKEIAVILGGIGAIIGSAAFMRFLGLIPTNTISG